MNRTLQSRLLHGSLCPRLLHGEMAERFNAAVLKTAVGQPTVGSNPTLSAKSFYEKTRINLDGVRVFYYGFCEKTHINPITEPLQEILQI